MPSADQGTDIAPYVTSLDLFKAFSRSRNSDCSLRDFSRYIQMPLTDQVTYIAPYMRTSL